MTTQEPDHLLSADDDDSDGNIGIQFSWHEWPDNVENAGPIDRMVRGAAGIGMIFAAIYFPALAANTLAALTGLSIYGLLTASTGWDPIYALLGRLQGRASRPAPAPPTPLKPQPRKFSHDYQKVA